ncbi:MAG: hypothetical protein K9K66_16300 [Desulfarculaceae bacterium]|nr:hypothetical protein [Desulfarculaceae bacterium]MCF8073346.1 hypothetical protein [Desulfarculaceae bacterium]MCF8103218.1 hypothetical protein [Desulfarculaceae bacterium]MCF8116602.1 hypothetical protein [Desulfarculaceae bacterium]
MTISSPKLNGPAHPVVLAAGFSWGLLAATRWSVLLAGASGGETAVIWHFPPWWIPLCMGLAAWVLQGMAAFWQMGWLSRQGLDQNRARRLAALAWLPSLALLLVPLAELLPPLLNMSLAPLALAREAWPLAALAAAGTVLVQTRLAAPDIIRKREVVHRVWLAPLVFVLALALFAGVGARMSAVSDRVGKFMGGDEPQYLFNTHSLAVDHGLDLSEAIFLRESSYFIDPARVIGGHGNWTKDGRWISKHRPGLPLIMAPFYSWGLYLGQGPRKTGTMALWLLAAWMVTEVFWLARLHTGREGPALLAAAGAALCLPTLIYSNLAFPGIAAAAFAVSAFRCLRSAKPGRWGLLLLAGALTGYLAWFHERFVVLAALLGLYCLARGHWRSLKGLAAFFLPCIVSAGLLMAYFQYLYGQPFPSQEIHAQGHYLNPRGLWEGLSGLWLDAGEGLLTYGAVWLAALGGLFWLLRRRVGDGFWTLVMAGATYVVAGLFADWHGGIGPPSRYLLAAMPFLAVGLAAGAHWGPPRYGVFVAVLGLASLAASAWVLGHPSAVYGHAVVLGSGMQFPVIDNLLPAFIFNDAAPQVNTNLALVWSWLALVALVAMQFGSQVYGPPRALAGLCLAFVLVAGAGVIAGQVGAGVLDPNEPAHRVARWSRLAALPAGGPGLHLGSDKVQPSSFAVLPLPPGRYLEGSGKPTAKPTAAIPADGRRRIWVWGQYLALPPGRYQGSATIASPSRGTGTIAWLDISQDKGRQVIARRDLTGQDLQGPISLEFDLPQGSPNLEFRVGSLGLAPLEVEAMTITRMRP